MVRNRKVFKKTVSIVNEKSTDMYESLVGDKKGFLLESYDKNYDRYTFFGMEPEEIVTSRGNALVITKADGTEKVREGNPLERLKEYYSEFHIEKEDEELSFFGGLVGNLGYDFVRYSEVLPDNNPDEIGIETIQMMLMTSFLMVDHVAETLTAVVLEEPSEEGREQAMEKAGQMIKKAMEKKECKRNFYHDGKIIKKSDSIEEYGKKVEKIKHYIREGHVFQTVLSQRWTIETRQTGFELYKELRELSYMGASVLHESAIFPVRKAGIPINIRNTNRPEDPGTMIVENTSKRPHYTITGVAGKKGFCAMNIDKAMMNSEVGFGRKVLEVFEKNGISFEHMPSGIDTMSVLVHQDEFQEKEQSVLAGIQRAVHPDIVTLESDLAVIAVVGRGMKAMRGTAARIFAALAHAKINVKMIDQGSSELNIIIGVANEDFETAIQAIYDIFVITRL